MWRTAASLELLPIGTKIELGEALVQPRQDRRLPRERAVVPVAPGRARAVLRPHEPAVPPGRGRALGGRRCLKLPAAGDALAGMARHTEDPTRDVPAATVAAVRARLESLPHAERLLAELEGEEEDDRTLGRIFGEELPSGWCWPRKPACTV